MTRYLGRNEIVNTKNNEFNSAAIFPVWHELQMLRSGQINVAGRKLENSSVWKDRIIVASTYRPSVQFGCYITWLWTANCVSVMIKMLSLTSPYLAMEGEPGKRHDVRAHWAEAVSDWLNPLSLGIMSASAYIDNLA